MPSFCAVLNCHDKYGHADDISFHKFPFKRKELMIQWLDYTDRGSRWKPSKWSSICSRHFTDDDFSCVIDRKTLKKSAVPTVKLPIAGQKPVVAAINGEVPAKAAKKTAPQQRPIRKESVSNVVIEQQTKLKTLCRLCGTVASDAASFVGNFAVYGLIQKCLPTLNIQQNDSLPKEACRACLQKLESFGCYMDVVLQTQRSLELQFSVEKPSSSVPRTTEKSVKIKQEPVVRVKQEAAEVDDSFLSDDLDMNMADDSFDGTRDVERKFDFCDFPVLNTQDIVNNCDIMEIINLDDAFINIPDDDGNAVSPPDTIAAVQKPELRSAHELLQAHLIMEEHGYAKPPEDLKEEWQIKKNCKTEKNDGYELRNVAKNVALTEHDGDEANFQQHIEPQPLVPPMTMTTTTITPYDDEHNQRSTRPIVTSVSAIADTRPEAMKRSLNKPNIVVLNESIVQSASAFQLHSCPVCQLRFFSVDSLRQHKAAQHSSVAIPMVSVPQMNIQPEPQLQLPLLPLLSTPSFAAPPTCKVEKGCEKDLSGGFSANAQISTVESNLGGSLEAQTNLNDDPTCNWQSFVHGGCAASSQQQNFVSSSEPLHNLIQNLAGQELLTEQPALSRGLLEYPRTDPHMYLPMPMATDNELLLLKSSPTTMAMPKRTSNVTNGGRSRRYLQLQRRFQRLQRKFKYLEAQAKRTKFRCRLCSCAFRSVTQLLRHKQTRSHFVSKPRHFAFNCCGCEKFFSSRLALRNHMRYICQQLSLRWCKTHLQTFKCRHCRSITFTHWRLYRQHENKCKAKLLREQRKRAREQLKREQQELAKKREESTTATGAEPSTSSEATPRTESTSRKKSPHTCPLCSKVFPSINAFNQHSITHAIGPELKCSLCNRVFKRRHGLTQHMRAFHLQLRPYECPVCQYTFALKWDMKRCRHSRLRLQRTVWPFTPQDNPAAAAAAPSSKDV